VLKRWWWCSLASKLAGWALGSLQRIVNLWFSFAGVQTIGTYELVLRALTYSNSRAHDYDYLAFTLKCSDLNGRYQSNTYQLVVCAFVVGCSERGVVSENRVKVKTWFSTSLVKYDLVPCSGVDIKGRRTRLPPFFRDVVGPHLSFALSFRIVLLTSL